MIDDFGSDRSPREQAISRLGSWSMAAGSAHLVEGAVLVVLGEGVLLQEVILEEACRLQHDLVILCQRVLHAYSTIPESSAQVDLYDTAPSQSDDIATTAHLLLPKLTEAENLIMQEPSKG